MKFEELLCDYFRSDKPHTKGLPTVAYCASELCLSPNYFGDLIKKETGRSARDVIQQKVISIAKDRIMNGDATLSQVAYDLGFEYPQHFTRYFKKAIGLTPTEYRNQRVG